MKKKLYLPALMGLLFMLAGFNGTENQPILVAFENKPAASAVIEPLEKPVHNNQQGMASKMLVKVGDYTFTATLTHNSATDALLELLKEGPLTINMRDYGGFEKVGPLGRHLPTNDESITTAPGDMILYQGNSLVIFYAANSWSYTRLGKIDDISLLQEAFGDGNISVTLLLE